MHGSAKSTLDTKKKKAQVTTPPIHPIIEANLTDSTYPTGTVIMQCL